MVPLVAVRIQWRRCRENDFSNSVAMASFSVCLMPRWSPGFQVARGMPLVVIVEERADTASAGDTPASSGFVQGRLPVGSAAAMSSRSATRSHDLLPLPCGLALAEAASQLAFPDWFREGVKAINELGGRGASSVGKANLRQRAALASLVRAYDRIPKCPTSVTAKSSVEHVLGHDPGYVDDLACCAHKVYQRGKRRCQLV